MKELKQRCSAAVHKQESLVRFTKTNDQKREENLNELRLRLNRQPKISDLFLTYENNETSDVLGYFAACLYAPPAMRTRI